MRILITNDDGILSEGLLLLAKWARKFGEVVVVAPKTEQSGRSHAINFVRPLEVKEFPLLEGVRAYTVDSTPADCVRYAVVGLGLSFDLVLAGVNKGLNIGEDIVYSGTAGAIFEAALFHIKAIAFSTDPSTFETARENLDMLHDFFEKNELFAHNLVYNVNIPLAPRGIRITHQGGPYYKDVFVPQGDDRYMANGYSVYVKAHDLTLDTDAVMNGYISILPLTTDRTNLAAYEALAHLSCE